MVNMASAFKTLLQLAMRGKGGGMGIPNFAKTLPKVL